MNANLPQLDLPRDYVVGNDITEAILNFYKQTCRLKAGIFGFHQLDGVHVETE